MHCHHDLCHVTIMTKEYCCGNAAGHFILAAHISHSKCQARVDHLQVYEEYRTEFTGCVCVWRVHCVGVYCVCVANKAQRSVEVEVGWMLHTGSYCWCTSFHSAPIHLSLFVTSPQMDLMPPMLGKLREWKQLAGQILIWSDTVFFSPTLAHIDRACEFQK